MSLEKRAIKAVTRFVESRGDTIIEKVPSKDIDIVYSDVYGEVHFVIISVEIGKMPPSINESLRHEIEEEALDWLADCKFNCDSEFKMHFDAVYLAVIHGDRAMLKYHHDCFNLA